MESTVKYVAFGLTFSMPREVVERRIMEMDTEKFIAYARGFLDNPYWPCAYFADRSWFKTEEEWQKYENEGDGHRLIRKEGGTKLYWDGGRLKCLQEAQRLCSG